MQHKTKLDCVRKEAASFRIPPPAFPIPHSAFRLPISEFRHVGGFAAKWPLATNSRGDVAFRLPSLVTP